VRTEWASVNIDDTALVEQCRTGDSAAMVQLKWQSPSMPRQIIFASCIIAAIKRLR